MIPRANVDLAKKIFADRIGDPYVYGGALSPDTSVGTDCSGLVGTILEALTRGTSMSWARHVTTESWPYDYNTDTPAPAGTVGPYGTISVGGRHLDRIPPDAAAIIALMHGGGGENSHVEIMVDGQIMESGGAHDDVGSPPETPIDHPEWTDYWYLPGPVTGSTPSVLTVPLTDNGDGTWTSPSPAWAHLIMRESSGNPTIIQQITDVNSGGNEAEGLFQITPATWRAHGGADFAASPRLATPQQQALVAARIFTQNPTGSDWGAGLPGREDANQLASGLVNTQPEPTGVFMALSDDEQRELLDLARQIASYRRDSRSPLRHLGEHNVDTALGLELNTDANCHVLLMQRLAHLGDPDALNLLNEVANADPARYPDRVGDRNLARAILNEVAMNITPGSAPATGQIPGVIPTPQPVIPQPAPLPNPVPTPVPVQPLPALPAAAGSLFHEITALTNQISGVSTTIKAITEG